MSDLKPTALRPDSPSAIKIDGYLTEAKLSAALQRICSEWPVKRSDSCGRSRYRWDMSYEIDGMITVVEYDGDEHYRHSLKMKADRAKDEIAGKQDAEWFVFPTGYNWTT